MGQAAQTADTRAEHQVSDMRWVPLTPVPLQTPLHPSLALLTGHLIGFWGQEKGSACFPVSERHSIKGCPTGKDLGYPCTSKSGGQSRAGDGQVME